MRQHLFQTDAVTEYLGGCGIDRFDEADFGNNDKSANLAVSDHRPVWAIFSITQEDDDGERAPSDDAEDESAAEVEPPSEAASILDGNGDGVVNILDLVAVVSGIGQIKPDVNGDGIVSILDLVVIAGKLGN